METIKPRLTGWNFRAREHALVESAPTTLPTWRVANQCRLLTADVGRQLAASLPAPFDRTTAKLESTYARRLALVQLCGIAARSASAHMVLIGSGYEREALSMLRTVLESYIRARQVLDDTSGDAARTLLQGRRAGGLKAIAQRYASHREVELLDHFAHADVLTLRTLQVAMSSDGVASLQLRPMRGLTMPSAQLLEAGRYVVQVGVAACEVFEVALLIPSWLSSQLTHYRDNPLPEGL